MQKEILGVKAPKKKCNDKNCPFHGNIKVRGRLLVGIVKSAKAKKTVTVIIKRKKLVPKYERYKDVTTKIHAHNPECISAKEGDVVIIGETRPISKTKNFVVLGIKNETGQSKNK